MRKVFFMFFCLLSASLAAQNYSGHLHLRSGLSVPLFEYSASNLENGSFTSTGLTTSLAFTAKVYKNWNAALQGGFALHPIEVGLLGYYKVADDPFLSDVTIRSEPFRVIHFVGGPQYVFEPFEKIFVSASAYSGVFLSTTPYQLYKPIYFVVGPEIYEITSSHKYSFAYGAGLGIGYHITDCYEIAIESDFMRSKAGFKFVSANGPRTDWRQISMLNISVSLMLKLQYSKTKL